MNTEYLNQQGGAVTAAEAYAPEDFQRALRRGDFRVVTLEPLERGTHHRRPVRHGQSPTTDSRDAARCHQPQAEPTHDTNT